MADPREGGHRAVRAKLGAVVGEDGGRATARWRVLEAEAQRAERASNQGIRVIRCDVAKSVAQVVTGDVSARRKRRGSGDVGENQTERQQ